MGMPSMESRSPLVRCRREGDTTHITLNRPDKFNALNAEMVELLLDITHRACGDGTRMLVLQGEGRNFSAGFDLGDFEQASEGDLVLRLIRIEQLLQAVYYAPYQTLALAHGRNFGAGVDLICSCNQRYAAAGSTFRMPGLQFGLLLGTRRFMQRVGSDLAREILGESQTFGADEALGMHFIHRVAEQEEWPALTESVLRSAMSLTHEAAASLLRVTAPDTRAVDLADLVTSASRPGLKERLRQYRSRS
jgi:enoyl-CoA hydratase/carnithine racemase